MFLGFLFQAEICHLKKEQQQYDDVTLIIISNITCLTIRSITFHVVCVVIVFYLHMEYLVDQLSLPSAL